MSDETNQGSVPTPETKRPMVELRIMFDGTQTQVSGPIQNELLCQAMLEAAGQVVRDYNQKRKLEAAQAKSILKPPPGLSTKDLSVA